MTSTAPDVDPRLGAPSRDLAAASVDAEPRVGRAAGGPNAALIVAVFGLIAILLFAWLNARRLDARPDSLVTATPGAALAASAPPLQTAPAVAGPADMALGGLPPNLGDISAIPTPLVTTPPMLSPALMISSAPQADLVARRRAPAVVVDFGQPPVGGGGAPAPAAAALGAAEPGTGQPVRPKLNDDEQFAARIGDTEAPERARATSMGRLDSLISQGAVIPAVLETAINSDLPGYTRAVVSRDVRSFDGKHVLIPRGSRLIGQYKSAVALGQSRAFVIWTRIIRPDGVSIQIGSPGTDALGRGGLQGDVNRHFFQRFGGSILLSVLNAGVASVAKTPSTQISIGSPGAAAGAAASAVQGEQVSPTIKVAQGEAIRIFVSRDLDFSGVGAVP
ncbi:TrbI/VirB10 family protein [Phenylobacterium sp.]|uniref:TrbI/VirB10 family protein n=1 Tax=Phenylobacterium sp. TaxID=1871053 RepID=UPI00286C1EA9|nr:TrbI/VirB10 family protein [Phenylobacterium sp.]